jgi:hypothetical protein
MLLPGASTISASVDFFLLFKFVVKGKIEF